MKAAVESVRRGLFSAQGVQARVRTICAALVVLLLSMIATDFLGILDGSEARTAAKKGESNEPGGGLGSQPIDDWVAAVGKRSLFKPAIPLPSRPMAHESVNRVRGMLSLHGIMDREGHRVAYISVKGLGMKPFRAGDEVEDLFRVIRIEPGRVQVEIAGERLELEM